ncbi:uncharacterized protein LOC134234258 isoform X2 [Saccostrea cucullata]|uniref:uncharacterized protein LOC134234258 isoform X2 n=1 Tax=Saccostrea cuccullata TaxID=36930 RepID=UPI002ED5FA75
MLKNIIQTSLFLHFVCTIRTENGGVCSTEPEPIRCCTNYKKIKDKCIACNGSYGVHCSRDCPIGYCGYKCLTRCDCDDCNSLNCSCPVETTSIQFSKQDVLPLLFAILLPVFGISLIILIFFIVKHYWRPIPIEPKTSLYKTKSVNKMVTEDKMADEDVSYDSVRESQMILDPVVRPRVVINEYNIEQETYNVLHQNN